MQKLSDLYDLVQALNQGEKKLFTGYSNVGKSDDHDAYKHLFEVLASEKVFDEANIVKRYCSRFPQKTLNQTRNYLFNTILRLGRIQGKINSAEDQLRLWDHHLAFLIEKKVYGPASKLLKKAKKLANSFELDGFIMNLLNHQTVLLKQVTNQKKMIQNFRAIQVEAEEITRSRLKIIDISKLLSDVEDGITNQKQSARKIREKFHNQIMAASKIPDEALFSFRLQRYTYSLMYSYFRAINELDLAAKYRWMIVKMWQNHPHFIIDKPRDYYGSLILLSSSLERLKMADALKVAIEKMEEAPEKYKFRKNDSLVEQYKQLAQWGRVWVATFSGHFEAALEQLQAFTDHRDRGKAGEIKGTHLPNYVGLTHLYVCVGKYEKALANLQNYLELLHRFYDRGRPYTNAKLVELLIHHELENYVLLGHLGRSLSYYFQKKDYGFEHEKIVVSLYANQLPQCRNDEERNEAYAKALKKLKSIKQSNLEYDLLRYFDFISWMESKLENRPLADVIAEKSDPRKIEELELVE